MGLRAQWRIRVIAAYFIGSDYLAEVSSSISTKYSFIALAANNDLFKYENNYKKYESLTSPDTCAVLLSIIMFISKSI